MTHYAISPETWALSKARMIETTHSPLDTYERLWASGELRAEARTLFGEAEGEIALRILRLFRRCGIGDDASSANVARA